MSTTVHRRLKVIAFNANGIRRQAYKVTKQWQELKINVALFSETRLKPHGSFYIPNYDIHRGDREDGHKGGTAVAVREDIPHACVRLPSFLPIEGTGVCIPI
jgi:exonuclease III